jgi:hypothetical protein
MPRLKRKHTPNQVTEAFLAKRCWRIRQGVSAKKLFKKQVFAVCEDLLNVQSRERG